MGTSSNYIFAFCAGITATIIGNMVQSNSVADALYSSVHIPRALTGVVMAIIILSDPRNGFPFCIMDGTYATALGTGFS